MSRLVFLTIIVFVGIIGIFLVVNGFSNTSNSTVNTTPTPTTSLTTLSIAPTRAVQSAKTEKLSPTPEEKLPTVATIATSKGNILLSLYPADAKNTVKNFAQKAKSGFYNGLKFHRVEDWVIQGGDPLGNGTGGSDMPTELNDKPFVKGALGVARGPDIKVSNDAQFFITKTEAHHLDGRYTNFGIVTSGLDVVEKIEIGDKIIGITVE